MKWRKDGRIALPWLLAPVLVTTTAGYAADILGPHLITTHPLLLLFLNPRNRYLLLAAPQVEVMPYFVVGTVRLLLTAPIAFVLGWQYGDTAIAWADEKLGADTGVVRTIERWFGKAAPVLVLVVLSFYCRVLAGAARMKPRMFVTLTVVGTIGRLVLFRLAGDAFRGQLETVLTWVQRYQVWLIVISATLVSLQVVARRGRGAWRQLPDNAEPRADHHTGGSK